MFKLFILSIFIAFLSGCTLTGAPVIHDVPVVKSSTEINYYTDIKPILDKRCVVCHSCYNSPCQLKMSSFEGLDRGLTKKGIYSYSLFAKGPTRLNVDAHNTDEWREKGFASVTDNHAARGFNDSLMLRMLFQKKQHPELMGEYRPETDELMCSRNQNELDRYLSKKPNHGMPYGFPAIDQKDYEAIAQWLEQGAQGPSEMQTRSLITPSQNAQSELDKWEVLLNRQDAKSVMSARYLYEHLFLAHLYFPSAAGEFYALVRSHTEPGQAINIVATRRPYDDPGKPFYYRLQKINSTLVFKTHITLRLDERFYQRYIQHFINMKWDETPHIMNYDPLVSANPFALYKQIPARSRYQFLLDNAEYIVRTFIRGPVCKGQIALNVINDKFWVFFLDPDYDLSLKNTQYLNDQITNLIMPIEKGSNFPLIKSLKDEYTKANKRYSQARQVYYNKMYPEGLGVDAIWPGEVASDAPMQTVYRHFDSATTLKGAHGDLPKTMWVIDFPLFERIYYNLVAGFDVFGNVSHQVNVRKYFNYSRFEAESIFLDFMPPESRHDYFLDWYQAMNDSMFSDEMLSSIKTAVNFKSDDYKREFVEQLVNNRLLASTSINFDNNYFRANETFPAMPQAFHNSADYLQGFKSLNRPGSAFVKNVTASYANVAYVRIKRVDEKDVVFTTIINRWHDNVAFMFDEKDRLNPDKDTADFIKGFVGAYPNVFFVVEEQEFPDLLRLLGTFSHTDADKKALMKYRILRSSDNFWQEYDWLQQRFLQDNPVNAGLFDLNRYNPNIGHIQ